MRTQSRLRKAIELGSIKLTFKSAFSTVHAAFDSGAVKSNREKYKFRVLFSGTETKSSQPFERESAIRP